MPLNLLHEFFSFLILETIALNFCRKLEEKKKVYLLLLAILNEAANERRGIGLGPKLSYRSMVHFIFSGKSLMKMAGRRSSTATTIPLLLTGSSFFFNFFWGFKKREERIKICFLVVRLRQSPLVAFFLPN